MTSNQIAYYKAREEERHNREVERENQRSNMMNEHLTRLNQGMTRRHYNRMDIETNRSNLVKEAQNAESLSQNYAKLAETIRSDLANEDIKRTQARADAYLSYSTAGLRQAETAYTDVKASYDLARTANVNAQTQTEMARYYDVLHDVSLKDSQREKNVMETQLMPLNTIGSLLGNTGKLLGGISNVSGSETITNNIPEVQRGYIQLK